MNQIQLAKYLGISCVAVLVMLAPRFLSEFWTLNILARALALGIVALSLTFLSSFCGMVSLCQMTLAGTAGYVLAILSPNATGMGTPIDWQFAVPLALVAAVLFSAFIGWISQRSYEVYLLMFTLAIAVCTLYFVQQNMELFNGSDGIAGIQLPGFLTDPNTRVARFYWLILFFAAALAGLVLHMANTPFGLTLKSIRDNPRRLNALGYNVTFYKIIAFSVSGAIAGIGGVLLTWYTGQVSPGSVDVGANVAILVICVLGGQKKPMGAFVGAFVYVLLEVFASELFSRERFNLVIGMTFLLVLYFSPNGILGFFTRFKKNTKET